MEMSFTAISSFKFKNLPCFSTTRHITKIQEYSSDTPSPKETFLEAEECHGQAQSSAVIKVHGRPC